MPPGESRLGPATSTTTARRIAGGASAALLALAATATAAGGAPPATPRTVRLAAGEAGGAYQRLASALAARLVRNGYRARVLETAGSYANADLLRSGDADLALIQSDVAYLDHFDGWPYEALAETGSEPLHVLARRGILGVYDELLRFGRGSQELYLVPSPRRLAGATFREVQRGLAGSPALPIGYQSVEGGMPVLNPSAGDRLPTSPQGEAASLVVIADHPKVLPRRMRRSALRTPLDRGVTGRAAAPIAAARAVDDRPGVSAARATRQVAIAGWGPCASELVRDLLSNELWQRRPFEILVIAELTTPEAAELDGLARVRHLAADPLHRQALAKTGIDRCETLVVLAGIPAGGLDSALSARAADRRSLLVAQAARKLAPHLHLVIEVVDPDDRELFETLAPVETVSVTDLAERLMAQAVINPGITHAFRELLTATASSSEIYLVGAPEAISGCPYSAVYDHQVEAGHRQILIGYRSGAAGGGRVQVLNPPRRRKVRDGVERWREHRLQPGDELIVVATSAPLPDCFAPPA